MYQMEGQLLGYIGTQLVAILKLHVTMDTC